MERTDNTQTDYTPLDDSFLHSAAVIDQNGTEVEITSGMIDQACDTLVTNQLKLDSHQAHAQPGVIVERFFNFSRRLFHRFGRA